MIKRAFEKLVEKLQSIDPEDYEELISFEAELAEYIFRLAVCNEDYDYVEEHIENYKENAGLLSRCLHETKDSDMRETLIDNGAEVSAEDYADCAFAVESVNGSIIAFSDALQKQALEKYKDKYDFSDEKLSILADFDEPIGNADDWHDSPKVALKRLGVRFENGRVIYDGKRGAEDGLELRDMLEELNPEWRCRFEGESWSLQEYGIYFIF